MVCVVKPIKENEIEPPVLVSIVKVPVSSVIVELPPVSVTVTPGRLTPVLS